MEDRDETPRAAHTSRPWRIHELAPDFRARGRLGAADAGRAGRLPASGASSPRSTRRADSSPPRAPCSRCAGSSASCFGWDEPGRGLGVAGADAARPRCRPTSATPRPAPTSRAAVHPLYLTEDEWAAEMANRTMHSVMHLGWVPDGDGRLPRPDGRAGQAERSVRAGPTWRRSRRSGTWWSTRRCCATSGGGGGRRRRREPAPRPARVEGFPRFGTHMAYPPPRVLPDHQITVGGAVAEPISLPLAALADLPRREETADFHCVAGWSATSLRWEGVPFARFYDRGRRAGAEPGRDGHPRAPRAATATARPRAWRTCWPTTCCSPSTWTGGRWTATTARRCGWSARASTASSPRSTCAGSSAHGKPEPGTTATGSITWGCAWSSPSRGPACGRRSATAASRRGRCVCPTGC